ncbi:MAG TPA: potassium-transporting ATPase subunit KdpC [Myxococcales bacterium]|jgi:K+-transporting ATPase ATPase C chain
MLEEDLLVSVRATLATLVLTGLCYPLVTTLVSVTIFPRQAKGSLVEVERGRVVGSELIGQPFAGPAYLAPRPSAAGSNGFDGMASGGSNLGPASKALHERVARDVQRLAEENPEAQGSVPAELVSASASGLDPHLSPAAAIWQAPRVARARNLDPDRVRAVIEANVEGRDLFVLGEPRVNVLLTNLALDRQFGRPPMAAR